MMMRLRESGFTLMEMIVVIVITGIIASVVAVFLRRPVDQYLDVARRAEMTDVADTALRRISRDLRLALPNSVRVAGACNGNDTCFIEFLPTGSSSCAGGGVCIGGGRYRVGAGGTNNDLDFAAADNTFEVIGPMPQMVAGDRVVVYNLGIAGADAYAGNNSATVSAAPAAGIASIAAFQFPLASPGNRFHVISTPVTYACDPAPNGVGGTLRRYWGYPIQTAQTSTDSIAKLDALVTPATATRGSALLATKVSFCRFSNSNLAVAQRSALVTMDLRITEGGETVTLYNAAHVSNQP